MADDSINPRHSPSPPSIASPLPSSQQSTEHGSGSTTQPNTPRPRPSSGEEERRSERGGGDDAEDDDAKADIAEDDDAEHPDSDSSISSTLSRTRHRTDLRAEAGLQENVKFDLTKVSALAEWGGGVQSDTETVFLANLFADIHWAPGTNKAFFKLRVQVKMKPSVDRQPAHGSRPSRPSNTNIFLFIAPERIRRVSFELQPVVKKLGANTRLLRFGLSRQGTMVLPPAGAEPKDKKSRGTLAALRRLAAQLDFTLYVSIPRQHITGDSMTELCAAISHGAVSSIHSLADDTASLYNGRGGQVIEGDSLEEAAATEVAAAPRPGEDIGNSAGEAYVIGDDGPPAYRQVGPGPPSPLIPGKHRTNLASRMTAPVLIRSRTRQKASS